jgi:hypothetical protein
MRDIAYCTLHKTSIKNIPSTLGMQNNLLINPIPIICEKEE